MMTMKEVCAYVAQKRKADAIHHRKTVTQGEYCSGLTAKEYRKVKTKGKGSGSKGRSYSHTKLWESQNRSERIHTMYYDKKYAN
mgnify:FL=1|jgi:hypothetical protein